MRKISIFFLLFLYIFNIIFVMRLHTFYLFPQKDTGVFLYIGQLVAENKIPYKDSWDHKPPLIYFLNGLLFKFFPKESKTIAIFECFWIFIASIFVFLLILQFFNFKTTLLTTLLFTLYFSNMSFSECYGMTETYQVLPAIISIYLFFLFYNNKKWNLLFLSGIFAAISFFFKQTGISIVFPILIFLLFLKISFKEKLIYFFLFFLGFLIPVFLILLYFILNNALYDFLNQVFLYNMLYIKLLKKSFFFNFTNSFLFKRPILLICAIFGILILFFNIIFKKTYNFKPFGIFLLILTIFDFYFLSLSKRYYNHYFVQLIPSLSLLSAILFDFILKNTKIYISIVILFLIFILSGATSNMEFAIKFKIKNKNFININSSKYTTGYDYDVIKWILENTNQNDSIYFLGTETRLNFVTKRKSPSKYTYIYPLLNYKYATKTDFDIFYNDLSDNKPEFIIDCIGFFAEDTNSEASKKFISQLSSFGFDNALPVYFIDVLNFIDKKYYLYDKINKWKVFKLKN